MSWNDYREISVNFIIKMNHLYMKISGKLTPEEMGYKVSTHKKTGKKFYGKRPSFEIICMKALESDKIDKKLKKEIAWHLDEISTWNRVSENSKR